jgi:hypothetical protein
MSSRPGGKTVSEIPDFERRETYLCAQDLESALFWVDRPVEFYRLDYSFPCGEVEVKVDLYRRR